MDMPAIIEQIKNPKDWSNKDSLGLALSSGLLALDWSQTHDIGKSYNGRLVESNIFLGKRPSREKINRYFSAVLISNILASRMLPPKKRRLLQNLLISFEAGVTTNNINLGVKATF
jgi:hypothetical protein